MSVVFFQGDDNHIYYHIDATFPVNLGSQTDPTSPPGSPFVVAAVDEDLNVSPKCLRGTHLAVVSKEDASQTILLFQDQDGYICYRLVFCANQLLPEVSRLSRTVWLRTPVGSKSIDYAKL